MKKYVCILLIAVLCLNACAYKSWYGKRPCDQPHTEWVSEDGLMCFATDENGAGTGSIEIEKEKINVYIGIGPATDIDIYAENLSDVYSGTDKLEHWIGTFEKNNEFTAIVKETTYFNVGQKIKFYRVDKETPK